MASFITKEEPLLKQLVRTRAMRSTREQQNVATNETSPRNHGTLRSLSQPPPRLARDMQRRNSALEEGTVYTLQFLPSSIVCPPRQPSKKKVSFSSVSQPDLTKLTWASPTISRCSSPSITISGHGSPMTHPSPLGSPRAATPTPLSIGSVGSIRTPTPPNWGSFYSQPSPAGYCDTNNNPHQVTLTQKNYQNQVNLQQQNVIYKPQDIQKDENCLSSLCCEICKLFPNQNIEIQHQNCVLRSKQDSQNSSNLDKNLSSNINEINYPTTSVTNHGPIDNRIEQAMDLVKSHLMNTVRSEVEDLKKKILKLEDIISQQKLLLTKTHSDFNCKVERLRMENDFLKNQVGPEVINQLTNLKSGRKSLPY